MEHLDCHRSAERRLLCGIYDTHPTAPEHFAQDVVSESAIRHARPKSMSHACATQGRGAGRAKGVRRIEHRTATVAHSRRGALVGELQGVDV
jgi:hypothetical protein